MSPATSSLEIRALPGTACGHSSEIPRSLPRMNSLRLLVFLLLPGLATAHAEQKPKPSPWIVTIECQMIILHQRAMLALLPDLYDESKIDAASAQLDSMIAKGEAELAANLFLRTPGGQNAVAETVEAIRYPTEYSTPNLPEKLPEENPLEVLRAWPMSGITPTAFETRNTGATLEVEPFVNDDGSWILVKAVLQHIRFLRWEGYEAGVLATGEHLKIQQPIFFTAKDQFSISLRNGQRALVGIHKLPDKPDMFELFLLHVPITRREGAEK